MCFSCCALCPRLWGPGGCGSGQLHVPARLSVSPPTPATWLSATEKVSVTFLCQEAGDTCGDRCTIWQWGSRFQESRGIKRSAPKGPLQPREQLSLISPPSPSLFCIITKESCRPLEHQVLCQSPMRLTSTRCLLIPNCVLIIPLLWHLSHYTEMPCFLGFVLNQTMAPRRAENVAPLPNRELNTA